MNSNAEKTWEYLVRDHLELRCKIRERERDVLISALKEKDLAADSIKVHTAFSIDDCLIVIAEGSSCKRRFFYHPENQKLAE